MTAILISIGLLSYYILSSYYYKVDTNALQDINSKFSDL